MTTLNVGQQTSVDVQPGQALTVTGPGVAWIIGYDTERNPQNVTIYSGDRDAVVGPFTDVRILAIQCRLGTVETNVQRASTGSAITVVMVQAALAAAGYTDGATRAGNTATLVAELQKIGLLPAPVTPPPVAPGALANVMILGDGDSKAPEMMASMRRAAERNGLDIDWSGRNQGPEGMGVGGSTAEAILASPRKENTIAAIKTYTDAGRVVDIALHTWTNVGGQSGTPQQVIDTLTRIHNEIYRASKVRYMYLSSINPNQGDGSANEVIRQKNAALQQYALDNSSDCVFVDEEAYLIDPNPANTTRKAIPYTYNGTTGAPANSVFRDQLHKSGNGNFVASFAYDAPMKARHTKTAALVLANGNAYGPSNLKGNLGGGSLRTVSGPPADILQNLNMSGDATATWSTGSVTIPSDTGYLPAGTYPTARLTFSGTTGVFSTGLGAAIGLSQFYQTLNPSLGAGAIAKSGALVRFNNVVGLMGWAVGCVDPSFGYDAGASNANTSVSPLPEVIFGMVDGIYFLDGAPRTVNDIGQLRTYTNFYLGSNIPVSGSIDFIIANFIRKVN